jgi:glycosyltransferase involved in cell wall biosynthesis
MPQFPHKSVSLVVPVYNEAVILPELTQRIRQLIDDQPDYAWEVLYINDGSKDDSELVLEMLAAQHDWLTVLHLSRNFGHQIAISAGIDAATGDAVILMDGDLQDPPELITGMLQRWQEGYDVVYATRQHREGEGFFKKMTAAVYYRCLSRLADIKIPLDTGDFRLMDRSVVDSLGSMREKNRFIRGMVSWVGFRQTPIYYERDARYAGTTKFTFLKMTRFAMDGLMSFSKVPLQWITTLGFLISSFSFAGVVIVSGLKLLTNVHIEAGWTSIMIGILMLGGIQLICLGMIGEYIGRIFDEVRNRPLYLIRKIDSSRNAEPKPTKPYQSLNKLR